MRSCSTRARRSAQSPLEVAAGTPAGAIASRASTPTIAGAAVEASVAAASEQSTELVVLSGGVFQNRRLLEAVADGLAAAGLRVLIPEKLPAKRRRDLLRPGGGRR